MSAEAGGEDVFLSRLVEFCQLLRSAGVKTTTSETLDATRALEEISVVDKREFYYVLKVTLVKRAQDQKLFDYLFRVFWGNSENRGTSKDRVDEDEEKKLDLKHSEVKVRRQIAIALPSLDEGGLEEKRRDLTNAVYSPLESRRKRVFSGFDRYLMNEVVRSIRKFRRRFATLSGRRESVSLSGELDLRRTLRRSVSSGGEMLRLVWKRRKLQRLRLVVLCDVSGSMDSYGDKLFRILHEVTNLVRSSDVFVFSTDLVRVTELLRNPSFEAAARSVTERLSVWGSGTQIGRCLSIFNRRYGSFVNDKTVVVIISDGWDVGDLGVLSNSLGVLRAQAARVVWLNPLADHPEYKPLSVGMRTALPYVDEFAAVGVLEDLGVFERFFGKVVAPSRR